MQSGLSSLLKPFVDALDVFIAASRASACADRHSMPAARDLMRLGIDPAAFYRIGRG
ncbi:hypothetical protein LAZ40_00985 [Cereibacter sphaeroides]|uniref:hypothetical protein n=1 Tax=Rhodobacterales TaxID=204455 RepID=UPI0018E099D7|nr:MULTISPECIES: hypothetical protein [Paracoccaceae]MCE6957645.1 hypothetical protein [Cereibacter sphaeroides]MCE6971144.1 hypothetical protein [Cereibacter sphaeroides]